MAATAPNRIVLASKDGSVHVVEALAGEAGIGPGDLLEVTSGSALRHNGAAGAVLPVIVALPKWWNDSDSSYAIDVDYTSGDVLRAFYPQSGDLVYMWLASGENAAAGAMLQSDGDGALAVLATADATTVLNSIVGRAEEAANATGGLTRVKVRIA